MKKLLILYLFVMSISCDTSGIPPKNKKLDSNIDLQKLEKATFAGGCFWCIEASFEQIEGVKFAISGYVGGSKKAATYEQVSSGNTNHAEAVMIYYDPTLIDYNTLLNVFFAAHDPTQLNRQELDIGTQYRSEIFYHNEEQKKLANKKMPVLATQYLNPIVTKITAFTEFFEAEEYHQDFEKKNPNQSYVVNVSRPKIENVAKKFKDILKEKK